MLPRAPAPHRRPCQRVRSGTARGHKATPARDNRRRPRRFRIIWRKPVFFRILQDHRRLLHQPRPPLALKTWSSARRPKNSCRAKHGMDGSLGARLRCPCIHRRCPDTIPLRTTPDTPGMATRGCRRWPRLTPQRCHRSGPMPKKEAANAEAALLAAKRARVLLIVLVPRARARPKSPRPQPTANLRKPPALLLPTVNRRMHPQGSRRCGA
mmetsp:Transcript_81216/g.159395  ORF Transcript_81216/g.159395 Transcript_81216/m.159395 type:complete len:211 (-) Transcript_81216:385-1017(-)